MKKIKKRFLLPPNVSHQTCLATKKRSYSFSLGVCIITSCIVFHYQPPQAHAQQIASFAGAGTGAFIQQSEMSKRSTDHAIDDNKQQLQYQGVTILRSVDLADESVVYLPRQTQSPQIYGTDAQSAIASSLTTQAPNQSYTSKMHPSTESYAPYPELPEVPPGTIVHQHMISSEDDASAITSAPTPVSVELVNKAEYTKGDMPAYAHVQEGDTLSTDRSEAVPNKYTLASFAVPYTPHTPTPRSWVRDDPRTSRWRTWTEYTGRSINDRGGDGIYKYNADFNGVVAGMSFDISDPATIGAYASYAKGHTKFSDLNSKMDTETYQGGVFLTVRPIENLSITVDGSYSHYDNSMRRKVERKVFNRKISGEFTSEFAQHVYNLGLGAFYTFNIDSDLRLIPYLDLRYQHLHQDSFKEKGPSGILSRYAATMDTDTGDTYSSTVGLAVAKDFRFSNGLVITPTIYAGWKHGFADRQFFGIPHSTNSPIAFDMRPSDHERNSADIGLNIKTELFRNEKYIMNIEAGYNADFNSDRQSQSWYAGFAIYF